MELTTNSYTHLKRCHDLLNFNRDNITEEIIVEEALECYLNYLETQLDWDSKMHKKGGREI